MAEDDAIPNGIFISIDRNCDNYLLDLRQNAYSCVLKAVGFWFFFSFNVLPIQTSFLLVKNVQHHQNHFGTVIPFSPGLVET